MRLCIVTLTVLWAGCSQIDADALKQPPNMPVDVPAGGAMMGEMGSLFECTCHVYDAAGDYAEGPLKPMTCADTSAQAAAVAKDGCTPGAGAGHCSCGGCQARNEDCVKQP